MWTGTMVAEQDQEVIILRDPKIKGTNMEKKGDPVSNIHLKTIKRK